MITPVHELPPVTEADLFYLKIRCAWENDPEVQVFTQNGDAFLCLCDGDLLLSGCADAQEMKDFIGFLRPRRVFAETSVLRLLDDAVPRELFVMARPAEPTDGTFISYELSSREVYDLLSVEGLELPDYESFAVDFCHGVNHGLLNYFALPGKCAAVTRHSGDFTYICGIASHEKGYGTVALNGILRKNRNRTVLCCCQPTVQPFYIKNGFSVIGTAGYLGE